MGQGVAGGSGEEGGTQKGVMRRDKESTEDVETQELLGSLMKQGLVE